MMFVPPDRCVVQVIRNILPQEFLDGGEDVGGGGRERRGGSHLVGTVPAQEMLLCNLPGAGGPEGALPRPRDQRGPHTRGKRINIQQPITNQHDGEKHGKKPIRVREGVWGGTRMGGGGERSQD